MRAIAVTLIACALSPLVAVVASEPAAAVDGPREDLTLRLLPLEAGGRDAGGSDAILDLGAVSAAARTARGRAVVVRQRVAVRLDSPSGRVTSARLQASLAADTAGCTVRVDGVPLSTVPRLLDGVHRVGATVVHEIEVHVEASAAEGALLSEIEWLAESD